jgi:hypothetical protein
MSTSAADGEERRPFGPTSGTGLGWTGVVLAAIAPVSALLDDHTLSATRFALGSAIFGLLVWCFMLRPRVVIGPSDLELRNPFMSWHVPLASIRKVAVRAVTRVYTDERRYDGVAVGRPARSLMRGRPSRQQTLGVPGLGGTRMGEDRESRRMPKGQLDADMTADFVVERILAAADRARSLPATEATPHRSFAWLELGALGALVVALVISLLV